MEATPQQASWRAEIAAAKLLTHPHFTAADWCSEQSWRQPAAQSAAAGPDARRPHTGAELASLDADEPVVLAAALFPALVDGWAMEQLTVRGLQCLLPEAEVKLSSSDNDGSAVVVTLGAFADYMLQQAEGGPESDDEPLAVFDSFLLDRDDGAPLRGLYLPPDVPALDFRRGLLERLPLEFRPPAHYLLLGPARSGTVIHQDPPGMSTWNLVTTGRKRWAMCSPLLPAALADRSNPPEGCDWSIAEWFAEEWPLIKAEAHAYGWPAFDFEQAEGELVYVPPGWWHAVLNLQSTVALNHTVLHSRRLRRAAAGGPDDVAQQAAAVLDAFKLVEDEDEIEQWLESVRQAEPDLLPPLISEQSATTMAAGTTSGAGAAAAADATIEERPWGRWGGVPLAPVGAHPWLLPLPADAVRSEVLAVLQRVGVSARAVFGRMYPVAPFVTADALSQSDAVCIPAAQLPKLLEKDTQARLCEAGIGVRFEPVGVEEEEGLPVPVERALVEGTTAVTCRRGDDCFLLHVLDGCAIRHRPDTDADADADAEPQLQPEPEPDVELMSQRVQPYPEPESELAEGSDSGGEEEVPAGGRATLEALLRHVLGVLYSAGLANSLVFGTLLGKMREAGIMAHDHDCDLLLAATDAAKVLELAEELEAGGRYMFITCTDLLAHEDEADCEHTLDQLPSLLGSRQPPPGSNSLNTVRKYPCDDSLPQIQPLCTLSL